MSNNKKNFEEMFKQEFNKTYNVDIQVTDFVPQNQLKTKKQVSISLKYATVFTICLLAISTCILGIGTFKKNDDDTFLSSDFKYINIKDDSKILKEENLQQIVDMCTGTFYRNNAYYIDITSDISLYVYKGTSRDFFVDSSAETKVEHNNIYFYVFVFENENDTFELLIENKVFKISSENNFGLLGSVKQNSDITIDFDIVYNSHAKRYNFTENE